MCGIWTNGIYHTGIDLCQSPVQPEKVHRLHASTSLPPKDVVQAIGLLEKLRIDFTKSRSRHSNDHALAESKNTSVVRKTFGYSHIPQQWAALINDFNRQHLNPYINYHRPGFFPETRTDAKGKERQIYRYENRMTPYDKLKSLPNAKDYLKPGLSFEILDEVAYQISDNQAADQLQMARRRTGP